MAAAKTELNWVIAAGIVGADIGTSVFYGTQVLFPIVGYLAPVFVLTACIMMWVFKRTYEEGLALSPYNGGAYSMMLRTTGRRVAVCAGALTFVSYLATAAVSALSGGFYLASLFGGLNNGSVVLIAFIPLIVFGLLNSRGIKEPAKIVTVVAAVHFALLLLIGIWGLGYIALNFSDINWSKMTEIKPSDMAPFITDTKLGFMMLMYGFAAAFLGITGFESAAQIVEELEAPILLTVRRLYKTVVILVSLTAPLISFLCLAVLSKQEVVQGENALLAALAAKLGGRVFLTIIVIDAGLTLFAATNTAFVGFIGLATTMAKQGNLPQFFLTRVAHRFPTIEGYPFIALPFMVVAMSMSALVAGEVDIAAKVYEIAFLGVMVSFCLGVVFMRNRDHRKDTPSEYLSKNIIVLPDMEFEVPFFKKLQLSERIIPVPPLISGLVLTLAVSTIVLHADDRVLLMLVVLLAGTLLLMAYYRWGELERRLESRSDLRLGLGKFAAMADLPDDLPKHVLCAGGTGARRLITQAIRYIEKRTEGPFELVVFHAEENKDPEGFFYELLQRVVSQQVAPVYSERDIILRVKILPGSLVEGLQTLKGMVKYESVYFGCGRDPRAGEILAEQISKELEIRVESIPS